MSLVRAALLASLCALAACVPPRGGWDVAALEARFPALGEHESHRLGDAAPYFFPDEEGVALFLCRWSTARPLSVHVPAQLGARERQLALRALVAWEGAGLGLRFEPTPAPSAQIEIRFIEPAGSEPGAYAGSGAATADCSVRTPLGSNAERLDAELVSALAAVRLAQLDALGRPTPIEDAELLGTLVHELGHALGFPSHVARGSSAMVKSVDNIRRIGRRLLAGGKLRDATLAALYALPSGTVVARLPVEAKRLDRARRLGELAKARRWGGPFARSGDRSAQLWWRDSNGARLALLAPRGEVPWPEGFVLFPGERARGALRDADSILLR